MSCQRVVMSRGGGQYLVNHFCGYKTFFVVYSFQLHSQPNVWLRWKGQPHRQRRRHPEIKSVQGPGRFDFPRDVWCPFLIQHSLTFHVRWKRNLDEPCFSPGPDSLAVCSLQFRTITNIIEILDIRTKLLFLRHCQNWRRQSPCLSGAWSSYSQLGPKWTAKELVLVTVRKQHEPTHPLTIQTVKLKHPYMNSTPCHQKPPGQTVISLFKGYSNNEWFGFKEYYVTLAARFAFHIYPILCWQINPRTYESFWR